MKETEKELNFLYKNKFRTGIQFKNEKYEILNILGKGTEGIVFVAKGTRGVVIIKEFFSKDAQSEVGTKKKYADLNILDFEDNFLMLELVVGPTTEILRSDQEIMGFDINYDTAQKIYTYFEKIIDGNPHYNDIIDIRTGKLIRIDPR